ncbi:hypothetical protein GUITHDRAFT_153969, partial [Guillardia theta CCMP2712]
TKKKNRFRILRLDANGGKQVEEDVALMAENVEEACEWKFALLNSQEAFSMKAQVEQLEEQYAKRVASLSSSLLRERRSNALASVRSAGHVR